MQVSSKLLLVLGSFENGYANLFEVVEKLVSGEGLIRIMAIRDNELCSVSLKFFFRYD